MFTRGECTDVASVCTTVDYKLVSDKGKITKVRASELDGVATSVLEEYVTRHQAREGARGVTVEDRTGAGRGGGPGKPHPPPPPAPPTRHDVCYS